MHTYSIDFVYQELTEEGVYITGYDARLTAHDGIFSINDFTKDLEKLYTTALFYESLENVCVADEDVAYNIYKEGKYFEGLPYLEIFKKTHRPSNIYVRLADRNRVK